VSPEPLAAQLAAVVVDPAQAPLAQVPVAQVHGLPHFPFDPHDWTALAPAHCVEAGTHPLAPPSVLDPELLPEPPLDPEPPASRLPLDPELLPLELPLDPGLPPSEPPPVPEPAPPPPQPSVWRNAAQQTTMHVPARMAAPRIAPSIPSSSIDKVIFVLPEKGRRLQEPGKREVVRQGRAVPAATPSACFFSSSVAFSCTGMHDRATVLVVLKRPCEWVTATLATGILSGCSWFNGGSLTDKATHAERIQCDAATTPEELRVVQTTRVLQVEGKFMNDGNGVSKVVATRILLRPPEGVSVDKMTRILQCHNARAVLGRAAPLTNDPYSLPNTWLDIDVREQEGNFVAVVGADRTTDNIRLLERAKAFAAAQASQRVDSSPAPPPKI
jgi:hypothetical protein